MTDGYESLSHHRGVLALGWDHLRPVTISRVVDGNCGYPIPDARVVLVGQSKSAITNRDGGFVIDGIAGGAYSVDVVSMLSTVSVS